MSKLQFGTESKSNTKHRWYNEIVAWANGEKIQYSVFDLTNWIDYNHLNTDRGFTPDFNGSNFIWRIKPKMQIQKYRMALVEYDVYKSCVCVDTTDSSLDFPAEGNVMGFIRWVSDVVEVEIPVNTK